MYENEIIMFLDDNLLASNNEVSKSPGPCTIPILIDSSYLSFHLYSMSYSTDKCVTSYHIKGDL